MGKKYKGSGAFGGRTALDRHKKVGKALVPPMAQLPNLALHSWMNDRMPEYLWAALLLGNFDREPVLDLFRALASDVAAARETQLIGDVSLSGLAEIPEFYATSLISKITSVPEYRDLLSLLLLFPALPGRERWTRFVPEPVWNQKTEDSLKRAVAKTLYHQSQEATDCRWLIVLVKIAADMLRMPQELALEIVHYPNRGDLRAVRPSIRAAEGGLTSLMKEETEGKRVWAKQFWEHALAMSQCYPLARADEIETVTASPSVEERAVLRRALVEHFYRTNQTTTVDAKHDAAFGFALFALALTSELIEQKHSPVTGRLGLRTLFEVYATLEFLRRKNDESTWQAYRVHGMGQAKLASLKLEQNGGGSFLDEASLNAIANEDLWDEFLSVNLGHWNTSNLREMCSDADLKAEYDTYYGWTSSYAHGQWGATREVTFVSCGNPLHRLHRIPRTTPSCPPSVVSDAVRLTNLTLLSLDNIYPPFAVRFNLT